MEDIKITLSTDSSLRSQSIEEEAQWMSEEEALYYPIPNRPTRSEPGCWVYFVRNGRVAGRSRIEEFTHRIDPEESYTYTDTKIPFKKWTIKCSRMEIATREVPCRGFQGFRYVTKEEKSLFEEAFQ